MSASVEHRAGGRVVHEVASQVAAAHTLGRSVQLRATKRRGVADGRRVAPRDGRRSLADGYSVLYIGCGIVAGVAGLRGDDGTGARTSEAHETNVAHRAAATGLGRVANLQTRGGRGANVEVRISEGLRCRRVGSEADRLVLLGRSRDFDRDRNLVDESTAAGVVIDDVCGNCVVAGGRARRGRE